MLEGSALSQEPLVRVAPTHEATPSEEGSQQGAVAAEAPECTVVYIAGYGRSGSTILGILLGQHSEIADVGELAVCFKTMAKAQAVCGCGAPVSQCSVWSSVKERLREDGWGQFDLAEGLRRSTENVGGWGSVRSNAWLARGARERYAGLTRSVFAAIQGATGSAFIVDSSKTAYGTAARLLALRRLCRLRVRVIHLVRDGRAVIWSHVRLGRRRPVFRSITGWVFSNSVAALSRVFLQPSEHLTVRYEDLMRDVASELRRIGRFLELDFEEVIQQLQANPVIAAGHTVGGNRARMRPLVLAEDAEWKQKLKWWQRALFWCCSWPIARAFGYR